MFSKKPEQTSPVKAAPRPMANGGSTFSVIGGDVTITGDLKASADLHVDGAIKGDITCAALVQGEGSVIEGAIEARSARLAGKVRGTINAKELTILASATIEGDVHYDSLTVEQGAAVEGRFAPNQSAGAAPAKAAAPQSGGDGDGEPKLTLAG
jgi:cytoskeletal protein CcmA (bactofilin family)